MAGRFFVQSASELGLIEDGLIGGDQLGFADAGIAGGAGFNRGPIDAGENAGDIARRVAHGDEIMRLGGARQARDGNPARLHANPLEGEISLGGGAQEAEIGMAAGLRIGRGAGAALPDLKQHRHAIGLILIEE